MIHRNSSKYDINERGTRLHAKFDYNLEVERKYLDKEGIQKRMDSMNNDELKDYLLKVEELNLGSPYFANGEGEGDGKGLGRIVRFNINKRKLKFSLEVKTKQQVSQDQMLNLDALDSFIAEGKYPEKQGEDSALLHLRVPD